MPSTYSSSLRLELQAAGENAFTWGTKTNTNLNLIEQAIAGYTKITLVSASSTYDLPIADASSSPGRNAFIEFAGTVASAISIVVPDATKGYWVKNSATGGNLTFRTSSGTGLVLPQNDWIFLISDGVSVYPVTTSLTNYARINQANTFTNTNTFTSAITITGPVSITGATVITSATDIRANLSVTGNTNIVGNVIVSGATTLASAVDIKGATSLASTLRVNGIATFNSNVSVSGSVYVSGVVVAPNLRARSDVVVSVTGYSGRSILSGYSLDLNYEGESLNFPTIFFNVSGTNIGTSFIQYTSAGGGVTPVFEIESRLGPLKLQGTTVSVKCANSGKISLVTPTSGVIVSVSAFHMQIPARFVRLATPPNAPVGGEVYYDTAANMLRCYNGSVWKDLF